MDKTTDQLLEWAKQAVAYGKEQMPVLVEQYLRWWFWTHVFWTAIAVIFLIGITWFLRYEWTKKKDVWDDDTLGWTTSVSVVGEIAWTVILAANIYYMIKVKVAPAVYIIDTFVGGK